MIEFADFQRNQRPAVSGKSGAAKSRVEHLFRGATVDGYTFGQEVVGSVHIVDPLSFRGALQVGFVVAKGELRRIAPIGIHAPQILRGLGGFPELAVNDVTSAGADGDLIR